ncbi:hypothetical protein P3T40_006181 [Paraburkholderia sp. EB58]|jgi:hypothetical protein
MMLTGEWWAAGRASAAGRPLLPTSRARMSAMDANAIVRLPRL